MLDLSKLTPMPWMWTAYDENDPLHKGILIGPNGEPVLSPTNEGDLAITETDAAFIRLASAAFEVMMRRNWYVAESMDGWYLCGLLRGTRGQVPTRFMDRNETLAAAWERLVEADCWFKANVERTHV